MLLFINLGDVIFDSEVAKGGREEIRRNGVGGAGGQGRPGVGTWGAWKRWALDGSGSRQIFTLFKICMAGYGVTVRMFGRWVYFAAAEFEEAI